MLKALVAPLDWGLGHATRCIPIIKELVLQGCMVVVAAHGPQKAILQEEFPAISFVEIPGYRVKYGKNRAFTALKIIAAIPKILIRVKVEQRWLRHFSRENALDLVISDNRYGLHTERPRCIFMTHQLAIRTGLGRLADRLLQRINYGFIRRYDICWVPDTAGPDNLAGELSHPLRMPPVPVQYIGWLSRLEPPVGADVPGAGAQLSVQTPAKEAPDLLILLSGPEPQRTILEKLLLAQLEGVAAGRKIVLVRGIPGGGTAALGSEHARSYDHLPAVELARLIAASKIVLSRPGYSTVMDLVKLGKRAIFVPTPGQTEQEYLGRYLAAKGWAISIPQRGFSLEAALGAAKALDSSVFSPTGSITPDESIGRDESISRDESIGRDEAATNLPLKLAISELLSSIRRR